MIFSVFPACRHRLPVIAGLFAAVLALAGCGEKPEKVSRPQVTLEGDRVTILEADGQPGSALLKTDAVVKDEGGLLRLPGRLVWNEMRTARVFPPLSGRVQRLLAEPGDRVRAGQALAILASADFGQAQSDWHKAQGEWVLAEQAQARNKALLDAGILAAKDYEQGTAEHARAKAEMERTSARLKLLGKAGSSVDQTYALSSPVDGVVVERHLNPGQELRADGATDVAPFVVTDPTSLWLQLDAQELDLAALQPGQLLSFTVPQYPGETFAGRITHVADFVDPVSRSVKVRAEVPNPKRLLKGEMFVTARVTLPATGLPTVHARAAILLGKDRYVFVAERPGTYRRQKVELGPERDGRQAVLAGLNVGDQVVVEGNLHLLKLFGQTEAVPARRAEPVAAK